MIICLSGFVIAGTSPTSIPVSARNDINCERMIGVGPTGAVVASAGPPRFAPHQHQLLQHFAPHQHQLLQHFAPNAARGPGAGRSSSSSAESVSSHSASPPPARPPHAPGLAPPPARHTRVRTLYACLGESEGELSFEPNQIITNVVASGEPGWLRGTLNGKTGLVPENYIEPLP